MNKTKVYIAKTDVLQNDALFERLYRSVSAQRQQKTDRYAKRSDKNLSVGAEVLLCFALKNEGITDYEIEYCESGKPYIKNPGGIFFNLSHSGDRVICALSADEVGCDTEKIRDVNPHTAKRFFCQRESELIAKCNMDNEKKDAFFRLWTLKESLMKATGLGLKLGLDSFCFDLSENNTEFCQTFGGDTYYFKEFDFGDGYKYAVCSKVKDIDDVVFAELDKI